MVGGAGGRRGEESREEDRARGMPATGAPLPSAETLRASLSAVSEELQVRMDALRVGEHALTEQRADLARRTVELNKREQALIVREANMEMNKLEQALIAREAMQSSHADGGQHGAAPAAPPSPSNQTRHQNGSGQCGVHGMNHPVGVADSQLLASATAAALRAHDH